MAENTYSRKPSKMLCTGLNTLSPPDLLPPGKYSRLKNVRADYDLGVIEPRSGIQAVNSTAMATDSGIGVHSIRRLNDNIGIDSNFVGDYTYFVGCGFRIFQGTGAMTQMDTGYSGRPMSLTPWRPDASPRAWMYIWDHNKQTKIGRNNAIPSSTYKVYGTGIAPPTSVPTVEAGAAPGPTGTYFYRYRYRSQVTGAKSNPSPVPPNGTALANQAGLITPTASTDLQMTDPDATGMIDIFRFGGALLDYRYVGSVPNGGPLLFTDNAQDVDLQSAEILDTDLGQPFTTVGLPMTGTATYVTNTPFAGVSTLTRVSGRTFITDNSGLDIAAGTILNLTVPAPATGSVNVEVFTTVTSDNTLIFRNPVPAIGSSAVAVPYTIQEPILLAKTLEWVWGPFQNSFFAVGDFFRPGNLYWTNGNDPDSASAANTIEVTNPSEPMMHGFTLSGKAFVFSSERLFAIYPSFDPLEVWTIIETPCQRGLLYNWAICTSGEKEGGSCWFLAKDGIYETNGGEAVSITDADLYNLFPHEGNLGTPVQLGDTQIQPPDLGNTNSRAYFRLEHYQGKVYFDYLDITQVKRTLVYDTRLKGWFPDDYTPDLRMHYGGEGREVAEILAGSDNGKFYRYTGTTDDGELIACQVRTRSDDFDDPGVVKLFGDYTHEMATPDNNVTITPFINNESQALAATVIVNSPGRAQRILDLNVQARNCALDFTWNSIGPTPTKLFMYLPSAIPKPEESQKRIVEWHEFIPGADDSYVMGIRIWCDTRDISGTPQDKTVEVWSDNAFTGNTLTINSNSNEQKLEFSWPVFKGKLARLVPTDTNRWKVFKWEWIAQPEPFLISKWDTNWRGAVEGNMPGYVTGVSVTADTLNVVKTLLFEYELEGTQAFVLPTNGVSSRAWPGRTTITFSFLPFRAEELRLYSTDNVLGRLYDVEWVVQPTEPRKLSNWNANWEEAGHLGAKFLQGCIIDADTEGATKTINFEYEDGIVETLQVNHPRRMGRAYSFRFPVPVNKIRALPQDTAPSWLYNIRYVWEPHPESVTNWETQFTTMGLAGYGHARDGYIALESFATVYICVYTDSDQYAIAIPSTGGAYRKVYIVFKPTKSKRWKWQASALRPTTVPLLYTATL